MKVTSIGVQLIADERQKQIDKHGFTAEHHVNHPEWYERLQLEDAAIRILHPHVRFPNDVTEPENWDKEWFDRLLLKDRKERLVIAGAFIVAELDRLSELEKNKNIGN